MGYKRILAEEVAKLAASRVETEEFGRSGTAFFSGFIYSEEYNADLIGERAIAVFDRMSRSDGQVKSVLRVCELPLLEANWFIQQGSDDALGIEQAQFVQDNLFSGLNRPWKETLQHILSCFRFGFSVVEHVYVVGDDSKIRLLKLAPRLAKTIFRWYPNDNDELDRIEQRVYFPAANGSGSGSGTYKTVSIPGNKISVWTLDREGNNFTGQSLLRAAYKHWYFKEQLYRLDGIANERQSLGVPWVKEPPGNKVGDKERKLAGDALASLHAHEKGYMIVPSGWEFGIEGVTGSVKDILPSIEHHDVQISRSVLAQFLNLGGGNGSYALAKDNSTFFLQALASYSEMICDEFNKSVIKPLIDLNWPNVERYPTMVCEDLDHRSIADFAAALAPLAGAGLVTPNPETENAIRRMFNLPELPDDATPTPQVDTDTEGQQADDNTPTEDAQLTQAGLYWRPLTRLEQYADIAGMNAKVEAGRTGLVDAAAAIHDKMATRLASLGVKLAAKAEPVDIAGIDVPYSAQLRTLLIDAMQEQYDLGAQQVRDEAKSQKAELAVSPDSVIENFADYIGARATALVGIFNARLKATFGLAINAQIMNAEYDEKNIRETLAKSGQSELRKASGTIIIDALNVGRAHEAKKLGAEVAQYSAIMDTETCGPCSRADNRELEVGTSDYYSLMPPYRECEGRDNCRCVYIYDFIASKGD